MKLYKVIFPGGNFEEFDDIEAAQRFAEQYPGAQLTSPDPDKAMQKIIETNERKNLIPGYNPSEPHTTPGG